MCWKCRVIIGLIDDDDALDGKRFELMVDVSGSWSVIGQS
jgi:hypothetical protein